VGGDVPVDSETLLVTDFVNLKIKLAQSFVGANMSRVYVHMFIGMSAHMCISIYICTMFLKKYFSCKAEKRRLAKNKIPRATGTTRQQGGLGPARLSGKSHEQNHCKENQFRNSQRQYEGGRQKLGTNTNA
jgi:hypothetical protein